MEREKNCSENKMENNFQKSILSFLLSHSLNVRQSDFKPLSLNETALLKVIYLLGTVTPSLIPSAFDTLPPSPNPQFFLKCLPPLAFKAADMLFFLLLTAFYLLHCYSDSTSFKCECPSGSASTLTASENPTHFYRFRYPF